MADLRPTQVPSVTPSLTSDVKRNFNDAMGADLGNAAGFLDMMLARLTTLNTSTGTEAPVKDHDDNSSALTDVTTRPEMMRAVRDCKKKECVERIEPKHSDIKESIKAKVREVMAADQTPIKDPKALNALKKVAAFLLKAKESGAIDLPPELVGKLQDFIAKDPSTLHAGEVALMMRDIMDTFKHAMVNLDSTKPKDATVTWTADVIAALKDLGIHTHAEEGKPVTTMQALRVLKALVNKSEFSALVSLADKKQEIIAAVDPDHVLLGALTSSGEQAAVDPAPVTVDAATDTSIAVTAMMDDAAPVVAPTVASAIKSAADAVASEAPAPAADVSSTPVVQASAETTEASDTKQLLAQAAIASSLKTLTTDAKTVDVAIKAAPMAAAVAAPKADKMDATPAFATTDTDAALPVPGFAVKEDATPIKPDKTLPAPKFEKPAVGLERALTAPAAQSQASNAPRADILQALSMGGKTLEPISATLSATTAPVTPSVASVDAATPRFGLSTAATIAQNAKLPPSPAAQQVMVHIQQKLGAGATQLSLQMTPVELGRVDVRVTVKADGVTHAVIVVDRPETLTLLQKDAAHLERALQQAGLNANQENMSFNLREQRQAHQGFSQNRKRSLRDEDDMKVKEMALAVSTDGSVFSNNRINYHA